MKQQSASNARLGIVISMFPELHETFILRELIALEKHGVDFEIFSLQFPRDPITIEEAKRYSETCTHYSKLLSWKPLMAFLRQFTAHPLRTLHAMWQVAWQGKDRPVEAIKNLSILPISLHFAHLGKQRGITHWHGHWANVPTTACWYIQQLHGESWSAAIHGEDIFTANSFLRHKLENAAFAVVCSDYFCQHLRSGMGLQRTDHVYLNYHGLDPRVLQFKHSMPPRRIDPEKPLRLLSVGRLVPTKGHDTLLAACAALPPHIDYRLHIVGTGPEEARLRDLRGQLKLGERVVFVGALSFAEVLEQFRDADLFCLAPRLIDGHPPDGIPNVLAEAMALGIPVIATRVSAIPELIEHGKTGLLVGVDEADAMAREIASLVADPKLYDELVRAANHKVLQLFDQDANITDLLALFERHVPGQAAPAVQSLSSDS